MIKNSIVNLNIQKRLHKVIVLPCLTYGYQTDRHMFTEREDEKRITICQLKIKRSMLRIKLSDNICNNKIRKKRKIIDVQKRIN